MNMSTEIIANIKADLEKVKPSLSEDEENRMYKIINPDIENYIILGIKTTDIEKIVREIHVRYNPSFYQARDIFKLLVRVDVEEYKFAAFFLLNRYKKQFDEDIPEFFRYEYFPYCHTWSSCDSCCLRVIGPFLAKKENYSLAISTIDKWSANDSLWIKRASIVILLKVIIVQKDFDEEYVFKKVNNMLEYSNLSYIEKSIGWLLKTCSKYKPDIITDYLKENKDHFSRLILRYSSEKLPKETRHALLYK